MKTWTIYWDCRMKPNKAMIIGLDAAMPQLVEEFVGEGKLPNIAKIVRNGFFADALAPLPTLTSSNWQCIATGAWPGTTGITDMWVHIPGEPLDQLHDGCISSFCKAEYLWNAAERAGKKSILMRYIGSWPPTIKKGIQVDGHALPYWGRQLLEISPPWCYSTESYPFATQVQLSLASDWKNIPQSYSNHSKPLETTINIQAKKTFSVSYYLSTGMYKEASGLGEAETKMGLEKEAEIVKDIKRYPVLIFDPEGKGYEKIIISATKKTEDKIANLSVNEWSEWIFTDFGEKDNKIEGTFRFKLMELSSDGSRFKLYRTQIYPTRGFTYPESVASELVKNVGPFIEHGDPSAPLLAGWIDEKTYLEEIAYDANWMSKAAEYLMTNYDWTLYFMQWHGIDFTEHVYLGRKDARAKEMILKTYEIADNMIGRLLKSADDKTLVVIVSDHGMIPMTRIVNLSKVFEEAGLLSFKKVEGRSVIDWSKTKAYPQRSVYIYVNLKGRDPDGIVEPGNEYEDVRDKIIETLVDLKDPKTNVRPVTLALKKEDARILGLYGDRVGDVIFAVTGGYYLSRYGPDEPKFFDRGAEVASHGQQLSPTKFKGYSINALLALMGPGVKKERVKEGTIWLMDMVPTVAHLLEIPVPRNADGRIIYEALKE